jgi:Xaa-Pro aminopeptidase
MVALDHLYDKFINAPSMEQGRDFPKEEYQLRIKKTRELMSKYEIDTLVVTSSVNSRYFTSNNQPHEWHDICQTRAAFYILTMDDDYLYMTPTMSGEHQNTARKRTWVTNIRSVVERFEKKDRIEIWGVEWMVKAFKELGLDNAKLGWELGDCQILGLSYNDFNEFKRLMPNAQFLDASPILRRLHQFPTPFQLERIRKACAAGVKMHEQVVDIAKIGMTEREFVVKMLERFREFKFGEGYEYRPEYNDIRNPKHPEMNLMFKSMVTERPFMEGDVFCKASSGLSYRDYHADIDRVWYIGKNPPEKVKKWYRVTYECAGAMGEALKPGNTCADVFEIDNEIAKKHGLPERLVGRNGHWSNLSGLSVHPDVKIVLEPGMVISVEPTFVEDFGYFDIEDIYLITENGSEILHKKAPEEISCCY